MTPPATSRRAAHQLAVLAALALAALTACATPIGGSANRQAASPRAMAACRARADQVYDEQNRGAVYRADTFAASQRAAPFAGAGPGANPSSGLSDLYARDTFLDDCLNGASGSADVSTETPTPDATPTTVAPAPATPTIKH